jgi:predicted phosphodiesterase
MPPIPGIPKPELVGDELLRQVEITRGYDSKFSDYQLAAALGLPEEIFRNRMIWAQSKHTKNLPTYSLGTPLYIEGDALVVGDVHVPYTDWEFTGLVGAIAKKHLKKPRQLVIAGDFFNLDIFSDYANLITGPGWKEEKHAAQALAQEWAEIFDKIYFMAGNHDRRVSRKTDGEMDIHDLTELLSVNVRKIQASVLGYGNLGSAGVTWRITHAKQYSINKLTVASELANKYQSNVISFHEHHLAQGWDRYHRYVVVNGGSLILQSSVPYCSLDDNKMPNFCTGFVMVKRGCPYLFGKAPYTDWERWL